MKEYIFIGKLAGVMAAVISAFIVTLVHERMRRFKTERIGRPL